MASWVRSVLYQWTHSKAAASTWLMSRQGPSARISSVLYRPDRGLGQGVIPCRQLLPMPMMVAVLFGL